MTDTLSSRLNSLHSSISHTLLLINQLQDLVSPCTNPIINQDRHIQNQENARLNLSSEIRVRLHEDDELFELLRVEWDLTKGLYADGNDDDDDDDEDDDDGGGGGGGGAKSPLHLVAAAAWRKGGEAAVGDDAEQKQDQGGQHYRNDESHLSHRHLSSQAEHPQDQTSLPALITLIGKDFDRARAAFRKAEVTAKRAVDSLRRDQRRSLLSRTSPAACDPTTSITYSPPPTQDLSQYYSHPPTTSSTFTSTRPKKQQRHLTSSDILTTTSSDITSSLRRTHSLLTSSLSTSHFASETLAQSTAALESLGGSYADLDSILKSTKSVLRTLMQSQKSDTWYLLTSFRLLLITVAWLVIRRFLWVGICIGWWMIKLLIARGKGGVEVGIWWAGNLRGTRRDPGTASLNDASDRIVITESVQGPILSMSIPTSQHSDHIQSGREQDRVEALQYIDKIATEMLSGAGIQTEEARSEIHPGAALPVNDVPNDPEIRKNRH
ncbi:hypothetical protein KEM54_003494, partial [Ascosphaera aggregata]